MQTTPAITTAPIAGTYWQWRGHSVYYVRSSDRHPERPPLLLIHGFGASTDHWRKNISGLSKDFEVWAIDLIGFGRSAKPELQYSGDPVARPTPRLYYQHHRPTRRTSRQLPRRLRRLVCSSPAPRISSRTDINQQRRPLQRTAARTRSPALAKSHIWGS